MKTSFKVINYMYDIIILHHNIAWTSSYHPLSITVIILAASTTYQWQCHAVTLRYSWCSYQYIEGKSDAYSVLCPGGSDSIFIVNQMLLFCHFEYTPTSCHLFLVIRCKNITHAHHNTSFLYQWWSNNKLQGTSSFNTLILHVNLDEPIFIQIV